MDEVKFRELPDQTRNAVRLLGGAALPAHFPPYIGTSSYSVLTKKRMAVILRNYRRALDFLKSIPKGPTVEHFSHGLYIKLGSAQEFDEKTARQAARELSRDLNQRGLPIRHAGSFGFDFAAAEWCQSSVSQGYRVRLSVSDLPTSLWDNVLQAVAEWWCRAQQRNAQDGRCYGHPIALGYIGLLVIGRWFSPLGRFPSREEDHRLGGGRLD
jgi:hypothetical protein